MLKIYCYKTFHQRLKLLIIFSNLYFAISILQINHFYKKSMQFYLFKGPKALNEHTIFVCLKAPEFNSLKAFFKKIG